MHAWAYKPVGFVSYGGVVAGARAMQLLKPVLVGLKMTIVEAVNIPFVTQFLKDGELYANEAITTVAQLMLAEVQRMAEAWRGVRVAARVPG
jgi:NAD(P)H-dependent FMN reductase